jgi:hypothetical protein
VDSFYKQGNNLLRYARSQNVIDTTLPALRKLIYGGVNTYRRLMDTVEKQANQTIESSPWLGKQSSWQLPQTRRYQQARMPSVSALTQPTASAWMAELSRFPVPFGSIGVIKGFEQYAEQQGTVYSNSEHWGNPFPVPTLRWYFRLSHMQTLGSPWINVSGASAIPDYLPGTSYDDFADTFGLWFPAGSSAASNVHFIVPGGFVLRLIVLVSATGNPVSVAAKIVGSTQSELHNDAQFMARTTW